MSVSELQRLAEELFCEIDLTTLYRDWTQDENAIQAWILEGSLTEVVLECHQPSGTVSPVIEFPVVYRTDGSGDAEFTTSRARLARFRAKMDRVPAGTTYRLFCAFNGPHTPQPGWSPGTRASALGPSCGAASLLVVEGKIAPQAT